MCELEIKGVRFYDKRDPLKYIFQAGKNTLPLKQ